MQELSKREKRRCRRNRLHNRLEEAQANSLLELGGPRVCETQGAGPGRRTFTEGTTGPLVGVPAEIGSGAD